MASYIVVVFTTQDTVQQSNAKLVLDSTKPRECMNNIVDYLQGSVSKNPAGTVQVTTTTTDPTIAATGTGATQVTLALN